MFTLQLLSLEWKRCQTTKSVISLIIEVVGVKFHTVAIDECVKHKRVWDRNYVILLHSYGDLCYRLHIYFLTLMLSIHRALSLSFYTQ
jgi:hypothetical protein